MAARYAWGDGRGKVHSIPLSEHKTNVKALHALGGSTDLTAPPTGAQAYREAQAAATAQFGPQVAAARQQVTNTAPWYQDFMARVAGYAQAANAQAAPVIQQAQGYQTGAAAQTAPGLDPNSTAGQQSAQAAQGRQSLAQLGLDALNSQNTATQNYLGGLGTVAAKELPAAQTAAANALATAKSQRGAAVTDFLNTARTNAQNYNIAQGTLGLNTTKAQVDAQTAAASLGERGRHDRATEHNTAAATKAATQRAQQTGYGAGRPGLNKYGYTADQWSALSPAAQAKARAKTGAGQGAQTGPYGVKLASPTQIGNARSKVSEARSLVHDLFASGMGRSDIRATLVSGGKVQTGTKLVSQLQPDGKRKVVKVPTYTSEPRIDAMWLDVALDLQFDQGVTSATAQRLHRAGFLVNRLGFKPARSSPTLDPLAPHGEPVG